ncbi:30S ribosomal protein S6 [Candidatus Woesebacteria bacterium RIFCSPHIGHO2_01_FULL_41_10]|uniref:Small ribosomal subunit protein bS6 n=1 Tax=Candidatus Woesebacteria bacterium RIFCSPHIGHO2_01_FULL_41_10 TaxID=1802500 RepID=A0A1F7YP49_9BACT|nr:MAG: 30S ribosomal protein S6 [Candidatus Woesebacteria bacterium RIFCSPHIGHO2_01_FULL_41_10]
MAAKTKTKTASKKTKSVKKKVVTKKPEEKHSVTARKYELAVVIDGESTSAKKKSIQEQIDRLVKVNKGKIVDIDDWGVKELAYKIKKSTTGVYLIYTLELEPEAAVSLRDKIRLEEQIIRHLFIVKD